MVAANDLMALGVCTISHNYSCPDELVQLDVSDDFRVTLYCDNGQENPYIAYFPWWLQTLFYPWLCLVLHFGTQCIFTLQLTSIYVGKFMFA